MGVPFGGSARVSLRSLATEAKRGAALIDHIYMDAMGFGMGCSCLQLTFQACNVDEARRLYDALIPVAPLMVLTLLVSQAPFSQTLTVS